MKIGTVISDENGYQVVTEITNGYVSQIEPIERFIARNTVIKHEGEFRNIQDIIDTLCDEYLDKSEVVMSDSLKKLLDNN